MLKDTTQWLHRPWDLGENKQAFNPQTLYQLSHSTPHFAKASKPFEPPHEISNNVVYATSKASDQPAHARSLIKAFASHLNILWLLSYWTNIIKSFSFLSFFQYF